MTMIVQLFKRKVMSERLLAQICQCALFLAGAIVMWGGFRRMADLELTEAQAFLGFGIIFSLVLHCITLGVLVEFARRGSKAG